MTRDHEGSLAFRHELSRRAVEERYPAGRSARSAFAHSRSADEVATSASRRLVHHADRAGDVSALLKFAPRAADRAAEVGAHREAVAHYRAALAHQRI